MLLALVLWVSALQSSTPVKASYYGYPFNGRLTANGERFNKHAMTAAHKTLPFNTCVLVSHEKQWVVVRVNDRGPYIKGRVFDLSEAAAKAIGMKHRGVGKVNYAVLGRSDASRDCDEYRWEPFYEVGYAFP
jgi:rare lipoprotein A